MSRRNLILIAACLVGLVLMGALAWRAGVFDGQRAESSASGTALVGGPFQLVDQNGKPVDEKILKGKWTAVFFGFTYCPEVCPTTLNDISLWLEDLGADADRINVALITVDPERDTVAVLADYLTYFDPRITGYTGTPEEIARAAEAFRVKAEKRPLGEDDYTMDHTSGVFLFRADGSFGSIIDYHEDRAFALPKIRRVLT